MVAEGQYPMPGAFPSGVMVTVLRVIADSAATMADPSDVPPPVLSRRTAATEVA